MAISTRKRQGPARGGAQEDAAAEHDERAVEITELVLAFRQVFRTAIRLRGRDTHLPGTELSHAQCELLAELYERGELPAGELALAAQLAPATVTQMLDHLAESGHVERARLERDRRVVVSRLTARGRREIEAKRERFRGRWEQALADLDSAELRAATRTLTRMREVFEEDVREDAR
jgi:DNA-binding MarR family transcriptional regulator